MAVASAFIASCTTSSDTVLQVNSPSFAASSAAVAAGADAAAPAVDGEIPEGSTAESALAAPVPVATVMDENDPVLPDAIAYVPSANPTGAAFPAAPKLADTQPDGSASEAAAVAATSEAPAGEVAMAEAAPTAEAAQPQVFLTNAGPTAPLPAPKKRGFLSNLFGATPAEASPFRGEKPAPAQPLVKLASVESGDRPIGASAFSGGGGEALPGVRQSALFEIKRKSGLDDDSDVDLHEDEEDGGSYQVASAAGLARLAPNGLLTQTDNVDVACLKPSLVRALKVIERHYGRKIMVTSGYRDPQRNRRARGAKNSLHMYCAAADVQVPGVSKWELASFVRSLPGRGGVGTYCHTESVHIDVGPERDWNWRCRGKRKRRA